MNSPALDQWGKRPAKKVQRYSSAEVVRVSVRLHGTQYFFNDLEARRWVGRAPGDYMGFASSKMCLVSFKMRQLRA